MSYLIKRISYKADGKVELLFDDKSKLNVTQNIAFEMDLRSEMELDQSQWIQLNSMIHVDKCRKKMLDLLSRRPHGKRELRDKLRRNQDFSLELIDSLLDNAEEQGFLNDLEFARLFVDDSLRLRKQDGPAKIRTRLYQKRISKEIIDQVMQETALDPEDEYEKILELALKKWRTYKSNLELQKRKARLYRFLMSRGFSSALIGRVVAEVSRQTGDFD